MMGDGEIDVRPGYNRTEVGVIPDQWKVQQLKRISPNQSVGLVINPSTYFDKAGTIPLIVGSNVHDNFIDVTKSSRITASSNEILSASRLQAGDLVTVRVGEPGVTAVVPQELNNINCASMMIIRRSSSFNSNWLCAAMNSRLGRRQVQHVQYGTAQKQFNISDAIDFQFAVPPFNEQTAIADVLSDVAALLGALDRTITKKRDLKQAAMQQLITGQTRLPGFHGKWEIKFLADCLRTVPDYGINAPAVAYSERLPTYIRITDISVDGRFRPAPRVSVKSAFSDQYLLTEGDIVFTRTGASVGKSYCYRLEDGPLVFAGFGAAGFEGGDFGVHV